MIPGTQQDTAFFEHLELREAMEKLSPRERKLLLLRFFRAQTQQQCALELGVSQVQVSRLERKILEKLRGWME